MSRTLKWIQPTMLLGAVLAACATCFAQAAASQPSDLDSVIEALRSDIREDKAAIIGEAMQFSDKDSAAFWPIYKRYEADLRKLNDDRIQVIKAYSDNFNNITDSQAKDLVEKSFTFESKRADLKKRYFKEFSKQLSVTTVAKFFQLEHRLDLVMDLKLAAGLPALLMSPGVSTQGPPGRPKMVMAHFCNPYRFMEHPRYSWLSSKDAAFGDMRYAWCPNFDHLAFAQPGIPLSDCIFCQIQ